MPENQLRISIWNMRGFSSSVPYLRSLLANNDLVIVTEHWLHENRLSRFDEVADGLAFSAKASKAASSDNYGCVRGQGGVAIIWHRSVKGITDIKNLVHDRITGVRFETNSRQVICIYGVYLPTCGSPEGYAPVIDDLVEIVEAREEGSFVIIGGDINGDLGSITGTRSQRAPSDRGIQFYEVVEKFNLYVCNLNDVASGPIDTFQGPTGSSTIDYVCIPQVLSQDLLTCVTSDNDPLNTSDHESVSITLRVDRIPTIEHSIRKPTLRWDKLSKVQIHDLFTHTVGRALNSVIINLNEGISSKEEIDVHLDKISEILLSGARKIPTSKFRKFNKPFWNDRLSQLKRTKVTMFRKWNEAGRPREPDAVVWLDHKRAKQMFRKELKMVSRRYENEQILRAVHDAELDRNSFWKVVKKSRNPSCACVNAIKNDANKVVYDSGEILEAWKQHFARLCTPSDDPSFDREHFSDVTKWVNDYNLQHDQDEFLSDPIRYDEVERAISKLHLKKACGFDNVSSEHLKYAGPNLIYALTQIFNLIIAWEYIPINMRRGIQVPLYKGKKTCTLDRNNYRGITLLTNYNKVFEMVIWLRLEKWWINSEVISGLQGACRKKQSCIHTAYLLQETVSSALEHNNNVFVAFFDVSKAFDTVWTDGLFYKLYKMGIRGRIWRILYRSYQDFYCRVKVEHKFSEWYQMRCGIHQGGFLSLVKYISFINELIVEIQSSGLCCSVVGIPSTPPGYADDIATACTSKRKIDKVLDIVDNYGKTWRFNFNAKKSAILVYGEEKKLNSLNASNRVFKLGGSRVLERQSYDHVGVKSCLFQDDESRVLEKITKGRRALNACAGVGIRKNGLTMMTCNIIFWSIVIPIVTFGCEIWGITEKDYDNLLNFQNNAGKRIQRFPARSPNCSSFFGLGWTRITTYIFVKKLLFAMSILRLDEQSVIRRVFLERFTFYINNMKQCRENKSRSPTFDLLNSATRFGVLSQLCDIVTGRMLPYSKKAWSNIIWNKAWQIDDLFWESTRILHKNNEVLHCAMSRSRYLSWWELSDKFPHLIRICENMAKLLSGASRLKCDDTRLKGLTQSFRNCSRCDMYTAENLHHLVMQCPATDTIRKRMYEDLYKYDDKIRQVVCEKPDKVFNWMVGGNIENTLAGEMYYVWTITGTAINEMYRMVLKDRAGVG